MVALWLSLVLPAGFWAANMSSVQGTPLPHISRQCVRPVPDEYPRPAPTFSAEVDIFPNDHAFREMDTFLGTGFASYSKYVLRTAALAFASSLTYALPRHSSSPQPHGDRVLGCRGARHVAGELLEARPDGFTAAGGRGCPAAATGSATPHPARVRDPTQRDLRGVPRTGSLNSRRECRPSATSVRERQLPA